MHLHLSNPNQSLDPLSPEIEGIRYRDPIVSPSWDWAPLVASSSLHCGPLSELGQMQWQGLRLAQRTPPSSLEKFSIKVEVEVSHSIFVLFLRILLTLSFLLLFIVAPFYYYYYFYNKMLDSTSILRKKVGTRILLPLPNN